MNQNQTQEKLAVFPFLPERADRLSIIRDNTRLLSAQRWRQKILHNKLC